MSKKNIIKKLLAFFITFTVLFQYGTNLALAENNIVDSSSKIDLYDKSENIIAHFYELNPTGYVIVKADTEEIIEYAYEDNKYINDFTEHYYYGGPLTYYKALFKERYNESADMVVDLKSNEVINISEIPSVVRNDSSHVTQTLENFNLKTRASGDVKLPHATKAYDYSPKNGCGATASGILLEYYDTYVSDRYIASSLESSDGHLIIDAIYNRMSSPSDGSTYAELSAALNIYLKQYYKPHSVNTVTYGWDSVIKSNINKDRPCILGLTSHPKYHEHWVVVTGYNTGVYIVNDGWGSVGIRVNVSYTDGCIDIGA